jgi:hypothetical protein
MMKSPESKIKFSSSSTSSSLVIGYYQKFISPTYGQRCLMFPSCSQYTAESIKKYGAFKGILKGTDRIMRCGLDLHYYPSMYIDMRKYYIDLPEEGIGNKNK